MSLGAAFLPTTLLAAPGDARDGGAGADGPGASSIDPADPVPSPSRSGTRPSSAALRAELQRLKRRGRCSDAVRLIPLLRDPDKELRREAELVIWTLWRRSGDEQADRLLNQGIRLQGEKSLNEALDRYSAAIQRRPDFAEAWNRRATIHYRSGQLNAALRDCDEAIELEPRHFGAWAGYGFSSYAMDDIDGALEGWRRALDLNPNLDGVRRSMHNAQLRKRVGNAVIT